MNYRKLGKTGLMVSEIGFGPEWMTGTPEETRAIAEVLREAGVNYLDSMAALSGERVKKSSWKRRTCSRASTGRFCARSCESATISERPLSST